MKNTILLVAFLCLCGAAHAQITVDTSRSMVTVKQKGAAVTRMLSVFRYFVPGQGVRYKAVYQPDATADMGDEPPTLKLAFAEEAKHIKAMLDAAAATKKNLQLTALSFNLMPYSDLSARLVDAYAASAEWNAYLKRMGDTLYRTVVLWDGNEVKDIDYDHAIAAKVLMSTDVVAQVNALVAPYGYKVDNIEYLDDHPEIVRPDQLAAMGKPGTLIVPVPNVFLLKKG